MVLTTHAPVWLTFGFWVTLVGTGSRRGGCAFGASLYTMRRSARSRVGKEMSVAPNPSDPKWVQFRRLLLGTVIESLLDAQVAVDFRSIRIAFDSKSEFRVPRLDNYMRFRGALTTRVTEPLTDEARSRLDASLRRAWPSLLQALDLPVGDRLTSERNDIEVDLGEGGKLTISFDLEAD